MKKALFKLVEALVKSGYGEDGLEIQNDADLGVTVTLDLAISDVTVQVAITEMSLGLPMYYVNFRTAKGDFAHYVGTPFVEKALMNLGGAIQSANNFNLRSE